MLSGIGVTHFLADAGILAQVRYASVPRGPSQTACSHEPTPELEDKGFSTEASVDLVERPVVQ